VGQKKGGHEEATEVFLWKRKERPYIEAEDSCIPKERSLGGRFHSYEGQKNTNM